MFKKLTNLKIKKLPLILGSFLILLASTPLIASADFLDEMLWGFVNQTAGRFVAIGGTLLNYGVANFVVGFGNLYVDTGLGLAIDNVWGTIRDVFNLFFIFGLIYIGFKMILDSSSNTAKRSLIYIFLAALLVNFSLFFSKVVVDFSNIAAAQIASASDYKQQSSLSGDDKFAISNRFMDIFGLSKIFNPRDTNNGVVAMGATFQTPNATGFGQIFYTLIIYLVTGFVFAAGGFLLIIRFVILLFFIVLSPVMFIGWVFPFFANYSKEYWSKFLNQAFFAPAYMLMLLVSLKVFEKFQSFLSDKSIVGAINPAPGKSAEEAFGDTIPYFIIMCGFLIGSIIVAKKIGTTGANLTISAGQKGRKFVQAATVGLTLGAAGYAAQRVVGGSANKLQESKSFQKFAKNYGALGRASSNALKKVGDANFDARNLGVLRGEFGKGSKGGNATWQKEKAKSDKEFMERLEVQTRDANGDLLAEYSKEMGEALTNREALLKKRVETTNEAIEAETKRVEQEKIANNYESVTANLTDLTTKTTELKTQLEEAKKTGDKQEIDRLTKEHAQSIKDYQDAQKEVAKLDKKINDQTANLQTRLDKDTTELAEFSDPNKLKEKMTALESEIKYQNILGRRKDLSSDKLSAEERTKENWDYGYLEHREKTASRDNVNANTIATVSGGIAAGVAAAALAAPVLPIAIIGAGGALAVNSLRAKGDRMTANTVLKEYGRQGQNRSKNKANRADIEALKKLIEENPTSTT